APTVAECGWTRFAADGATVAVGEREVRWFDPKAGKVTHTADGPQGFLPAFSPDGRLLAWATRNALHVCDAATGRAVVANNLSDMPGEEVSGVAVSPDGKMILTKVGDSGTIRIWDSAATLKGAIKSNRWGGRYPAISIDARRVHIELAKDIWSQTPTL